MTRPTNTEIAALLREVELFVESAMMQFDRPDTLIHLATIHSRIRAMAEMLEQPRDLDRYGVNWEGIPANPLLVPMPDGYWTPWHVAMGHPSMPQPGGSTLAPRPAPVVPPLEPLP